jgi:hypothetical protein
MARPRLRADLQYRSSGSALKDQWDHRRVNHFGGDFFACERRAAGGPSCTGRRCGDSFLVRHRALPDLQRMKFC